jgi:hypothetical protein
MFHNKSVIPCRELVFPRRKKGVVGLIVVFKDNPLASPLFTPLQTTNIKNKKRL